MISEFDHAFTSWELLRITAPCGPLQTSRRAVHAARLQAAAVLPDWIDWCEYCLQDRETRKTTSTAACRELVSTKMSRDPIATTRAGPTIGPFLPSLCQR